MFRGVRWGRIRLVLAWSCTVGLVAYLALSTDLAEAWKAFSMARLGLFVAALVVFTPAMLLADAVTARFVITRTGFEVRLWDFIRVRGVSYLANAVNYGLALAVMTALLARSRRKGLVASGSPFLLLGLVDLAGLSLVVIIAIVMGAVPFDRDTNIALAFVSLCIVVVLPLVCLAARFPPLRKRIARGLVADALAPFRGLGWWDLTVSLILRVGFILATVAAVVVFLMSFGFDVPFFVVSVYESILSLVYALPISVSGLGSAQIVMREFYAAFAPDGVDAVSAVDAFSTAVITGELAVRIVIGLAFLPTVSSWIAQDGDTSG